jgi:hypothetical protein
MNRADLKLLAKILEEPPECTHASLERLAAELLLTLDAKDITAGKLVEITVEKGTGREGDALVHTQLLARPVGEHFAVHKTEDAGWSVTHRPTGLLASSYRKGAKIAAAIAMALQRVKGIDWSKTEPLKGIDLEVSKFAGQLGRCDDLAELADCEKEGVLA